MDEKRTRRSSILKTSKMIPAANESDSEDGGWNNAPMDKSTRRVSFARVNIVKPFVIDAEVNTIWDSTIEEDANHTDSAHEVQDRGVTIQTQKNMNITTYDEKDMSQTFHNIPQIFKEGVDKENMPILPRKPSILDYAIRPAAHKSVGKSNASKSVVKLSIVDYARRSAKHQTFGESNTTKSVLDMDFTNQTNVDMEITCQKPEGLNNNETLTQDTGNQTTFNLVDISCQDQEFSQLDNMELTCQVSKYNYQMPENMDLTCNSLIVEDNTKQSVVDMESAFQMSNVSCLIPDITQNNVSAHVSSITCPQLLSKSNCQILKEDNRHSVVDMEFTCQVPNLNSQMPQTNMSNIAMDLTCQTVVDNSNQSRAEFGLQLSNVNCHIPDVKPNNVSDVCKDPQVLSESNCQILQEDNRHSVVDMEFTCQVPNLNCQMPQTNMSNIAMDLTCPTVVDNSNQSRAEFGLQLSNVNCHIPDVKPNNVSDPQVLSESNCQIFQEDNRHSVVDMEFTCQVPNLNCQMPENNMSNNGMDHILPCPIVINNSEQSRAEFGLQLSNVNCQMPDIAQNVSDVCKDTQILSKSNSRMDWSGPLTSSQEHNQTVSKVSTQFDLNKSDNMEFTCHLPQMVGLTLEPNCQIPSPSNFDQDCQLTLNNTESKESHSVYIEPMEIPSVEKTLLKIPDVHCQIVNTPQRRYRNNSERSPSLIPFKSFTKPSFKINFSEKENFTAQMSQLNFTNISSGVDDTQHLIHCAFTNSVLNEQSAPDEQQFTPPKIPEANISDFNETNLEELRCNSKLANVNDTYALKFKKNLSPDVESVNSSLGIIENLDDCEDIATYFKKPYKFEEFKFDIKSTDRIKALNIESMARRSRIRKFYEEFEYKPIIVPKEIFLERQSLSDSESLLNVSEEINNALEFTLEERIKEKQLSAPGYWRLVGIDSNVYKFSTLYDTLDVTAETDPNTDNVVDLNADNQLKSTCHPLALYIMKLFLDKLKDTQIKSAIGKNYDILTLLDYIQLTMARLHALEEELKWNEYLTIDEHFVARYKIHRVHLNVEVCVDVSDLESSNLVEHLQIIQKVGKVNEEEIKRLIRNCRKGFDFFKDFSTQMEEFQNKGRKTKFVSKVK